MKKSLVFVTMLTMATLGGCSEYNRTDRTIAGGLIGAGIGGIAGGGKGAVIGGVSGAVIGNLTTPEGYRCRYVSRRTGRCYR
jgi:hypothetical protein